MPLFSSMFNPHPCVRSRRRNHTFP
jgi:hypothetical protein